MDGISPKVIAYVFGALAIAIYGFITYLGAYMHVFIVNVIAMTLSLYVGSSIVVGGELKRLLNVFIISFLAVTISDLCFAFFQPFIALCISLFVLLVIIKYSLIKDHDSGWFGALCAGLMSLVFLLMIEMILAIARLLLF